MDVSLTEGTAMPRSAPAVRSLVSFKGGFSHWVECSLPISCLSFLQRELALRPMPPLPVGKVLRRQVLCFWHHHGNLSQFSEKIPPLTPPCKRTGTSLSQAALVLPLHPHPGGGSSAPAVCRQGRPPPPSPLLPLLLPFPPHLTHESFTNSCYSEAKRKQKIGKEEPSKCMVRFSRKNLLSRQGHFAWLLAPLVSSQIAQADCFSLSLLDESVPQLSTLIFQF